jgi:small subunit ribosomal protein S4
MIIGPKYKIARRLGAPIFEKTQSHKFKSAEGKKTKGRMKATTNFGIQLLEKQKARFTYGVSEKQFANYVKKIIEKKVPNPHERLYENLESRLDNVIYRIGLGSTRSFARQIVSHGHIMVNGRRVNVPSYSAKKGDVITIREGSINKPIFKDLNERLKDREIPGWIVKDSENQKWTIKGGPEYKSENMLFDLNAVIQYYKR